MARLPVPPRRLLKRTGRYGLGAEAQVGRRKSRLAMPPYARSLNARAIGAGAVSRATSWCWCRPRDTIKKHAGEFEHRPTTAVKSASGNMHRLQAPRGYWRRGVVEGDRRVAVAQGKRVRRSPVHCEIACLDGCWIDGVAHVDSKVNRRGEHHAAATRGAH